MDEKSLQAQDVLMQPVQWEGQEYFTSQYFHRQYRNSTGLDGKYERHGDFTRLLRSIEAYPIYVEQGDIVELPWQYYKLFKNNTNAEHTSVKILDEMFFSTRYNPLTLINKTGQVALTHHLDDELSKQMSVAANTMVARKEAPVFTTAEALLAAVQQLVAIEREQREQKRQLAEHDDRIKLLEASQGSDTGYVTVLGYCRLRGLKRSLTESQAMGKEATKRAKELGLKLGEVPDERWGKVKSYPTDFLDELFLPKDEQPDLDFVSRLDFPDPKDW